MEQSLVDWYNANAARRYAEFVRKMIEEQYLMPDVKGYTPLSDDKKELANVCKEIEERMLRYLDGLKGKPEIDQRCLALAVTNVQQGCMWAVRSIFQPQRIALPEDSVTVGPGQAYTENTKPSVSVSES